MRQVEADWLRQAEPPAAPPPVSTRSDAAGACDGVKNGRYAFHTAQEPDPWWQVDLGGPVPIARVVVYNRLDYAPGLHNADNLLVLTSDDAKAWTTRYDNAGRHFGCVGSGKPLEVAFDPGAVRARFVRLQVRSDQAVFFHLDEVEVYGPADPAKNLALGRPADQSSLSPWSTAKVREDAPAPAAAYPTGEALERGRRLAADLRAAGVATAECERELDAAAARLAALPADAPADARRALYLDARRAVRRLALANPLLGFDRLLFVKRFTQETYPDVCLNHMPWVSRPGGDLCVLEPVAPGGAVRPLLAGALGHGHVHGMDLWWDATRVVFGWAKARGPGPPEGWLDRARSYDLRRSEEPTHLYEIGIDGTGLRQLTDGPWSDLDPTYLAGGDVAFASERCACSLQCNEFDKDETSCNLYAARPDGSGVRRLSASKDGDYLPHALDDGTIGYTRWEYQERGWAHIQSIWTVRPDGTGADALFKQHFNEPWALEDARSIPGSTKLVAIATGHHTLAAGPVVVVDPGVGINEPAGIRIVTPGVRPPEGGMAGLPVDGGGVPDSGGFYMTPWPLSQEYFLVSYGYGGQTDPTGYALYLIDVFGNKELLYRDPAISCFAPVPLRPRPRPPVLADATDLFTPYAVCTVADVGRGVDGVDPRAIRYLRIAQRLPWPYDRARGGMRYETDAKAVGVSWTPVRILGTVPVEADGSAAFRVPADAAVYFQLLDADGMELRRMRSFISFQPGERRACTGCHETRAAAPVADARTLALAREPSVPRPPPWGTRPVSFLRDLQPLLDRRCVRCHGGLKPAGGLDYSGGLTALHNRAYDTILGRGLVALSDKNDDAKITPPLAFGSHRSRLVEVLRKEPHIKRAPLDAEEWERLVTWIDANAPYHDAFIDKRPAEPPYDLAADADLARRIAAVHARRCAGCHAAEAVSRLDWVDLRDPGRSRFLAAPLAKEAGGAGACKEVIYKDAADPDYRAVREAVEAAVRRAWARPRRDLRAVAPEVRAAEAGTPRGEAGPWPR
jgi:mono/diheme cytochrome c family protein